MPGPPPSRPGSPAPAPPPARRAGTASLPGERRNYVSAITGRTADDWAAQSRGSPPEQAEEARPTKCLIVVAAFRRGSGRLRAEPYEGPPIAESPLAPWGVQIAG